MHIKYILCILLIIFVWIIILCLISNFRKNLFSAVKFISGEIFERFLMVGIGLIYPTGLRNLLSIDISENLTIKIKKRYQNQIDQLIQQNLTLITNRNKLIKSDQVNIKSDQNDYWDGVRYGYSLYKKDNKVKATFKFDRKYLFTLRQIRDRKNNSENLISAYLADHGYVKLVWNDIEQNKYHYDITDSGLALINRHRDYELDSSTEHD